MISLSNQKYLLFLRKEIESVSFIDTLSNSKERIDRAYSFLGANFRNFTFNKAFLSPFLHNYDTILEYHLERVRQLYFPNLPSRLSCLFAIKDLSTSQEIKNRYNWNSELIEIYCCNQSKIHYCDMNWIEYFSSLLKQNYDIPDDFFKFYWNSIPENTIVPDAPAPVWEYLIEGQIYLNHSKDDLASNSH
ncbi:MAG: DUF2441 domain-containing protein [Cetobacterium sp.]